MSLIEIGIVVIEIKGVKNGKLAVSVNNTLVHHTAFLVADTQPCVLMCISYNVVTESMKSAVLIILNI